MLVPSALNTSLQIAQCELALVLQAQSTLNSTFLPYYKH